MRFMPNIPFLLGVLAHPRSHPTHLAYANGFAYGVGLNMLGILMPLYAHDLGYSLTDLGIIVAAPAVFMILLRLPGGGISDRFGEKIVLWFSFSALVISSIIAFASESLWPIIAAQLFNGMSRSVYWSAGQSYASRSAEGEPGKIMGRLLSFESTGGILGGIAIGFVAQIIDFQVAFLITAVVNGTGILVTTALPPLPRKDQVRSFWATLGPAVRMLGARHLFFAHMVAFAAASYAGLIAGLFLVFFKEAGYEEGMVGVIRSLNSAGLAAVAYVFGSIMDRFGARNTGMLGIAATGLLSLGIAATGEVPVLPIVMMAVAGATFGSLRALYPALAAQNSAPHQRGIALSAVSLYWAFAMLLSPLIFGFIADATSITTAIYIYGAFAVVLGLLAPLVWAYARGGVKPAQEPAAA